MFQWWKKWKHAKAIYNDALAAAVDQLAATRQLIITTATEEAAKQAAIIAAESKAAVKKLARAVKDDLAKIQQEAKKKGFAAGKNEGLAAGAEEGRRAAFAQMAAAYNVTLNASEADWYAPLPLQLLSQHYANIYLLRNSYVVRLIADGRRRVKYFSFQVDVETTKQVDVFGRQRSVRTTKVNTDSQLAALFAALLYTEIYSPPPAGLVSEAAQVASRVTQAENKYLEAHLYLCRAKVHTAVARGWCGQDPVDRFNITDPATLNEPWPVLFSQVLPKRTNAAFAELGLGAAGQQTGVRTVRDLLLLTADDFEGAYNFGPAAVSALRQLLAKYGLALWDDPVPVSASERLRRSRERQGRVIDLGNATRDSV